MNNIETNQMDGPEGRKIAWRRTGAGDPVLLLHGITEGSVVFEPVMERLADDYDVVAIDMAGHGDSSAPGIVGMNEMAADAGLLAQTLGLKNPLLIGHSYGGIIAGILAANGLGCGAVLVDQMFELSEFRKALLANRELLEGENFHPFIDQLFMSLGMDKLNRDDFTLLENLHARADQDFVLAQWAGVLADDIGPLEELTDGVLRAIKSPLLSMHAMDEATGAPYREWLVERVPHAQVEFWGDLGHWLHLVEPDRFCQHVRDFDPRQT